MLSPDQLDTRKDLLLAPEWLMLPEGPQQDMAVLVRDGRFAQVGRLAEVSAAHPGLAPIALPHRLLMPGLVDTHTHLTQSFGKALAFGEPSEIFRRIWVPMESMLGAEAAYLAAKLSALECCAAASRRWSMRAPGRRSAWMPWRARHATPASAACSA